MPTMTAHAAGTFCWPELATTDQAAALEFYKSVFDWTSLDVPIPGGVYTMLKLDANDVGAAYTLMPEMVKQGVPPHWMSYIATADADVTCAKVTANGGRVVFGPMDVKPDGSHLVGRMASCLDPEGAAFSVWQAGSHCGASLIGEPGSLCWVELYSRDTDAALKFYRAVFGWDVDVMEFPGMRYTIVKAGDIQTGGVMPMPPEMGPAPAHWLTYFAVDDCELRTAKAKAGGGQVFVEPRDVPGVGRMAVIQDPQGAAFAIIKLVAQG
jgi:predicted enzyme related to lactoylglutathione lyase